MSAAYGVAHVPAGLDIKDAGALGLAGTAAFDSLTALDVAKGETVLVSGATGGVGALAEQLGAATGAHVIATARPGAEADFITGLTDADVAVVDFTGDLAAQVRALAPEGVDAIMHLAGDGTELARLLKPGGRIASTMGLTQEAITGQDVTVHGVMADANAQTLTALAEKAASGALRVPVSATFPLEQAADAFAAFGAGTLGKIAITCS